MTFIDLYGFPFALGLATACLFFILRYFIRKRKQPEGIEGIVVILHRLEDLITNQNQKIMASQKELTDQINALTGVVVKVGGETRTLLTKIEELLAVIAAGGEVSPELQTAVDELKAQVTVVDELVPDAPTPG